MRPSPPMVVSKRRRPSCVHDAVAHATAVEGAAVDLLDLVAVVRVAQEEREVREQVEAIAAHVGERLELAVVARAQLVLDEHLVAAVLPPSSGSIEPKREIRPRSTARAGNLARAVPVAAVAHLADAELRARRERRTVSLLKSLYLSQRSGLSKGPFWRPTSAANVAFMRLELGARDQQGRGSRARRDPGEPVRPKPTELCSKASRETMLTAPAVAKSPWFAKYGPFGDLDALDHLGDDEVGVAEALTVRVRDHVDRACRRSRARESVP